MKPFRLALHALILLTCLYPLHALEELWTRVLSGDMAGPPAFFEDRVFVGATDKSITCLDSRGSFLWSRPLKGSFARYVSVLPGGVIVACGESGVLTAFGNDGLFLWQISGAEKPIMAPHVGRDGRIFVFGRNSVSAITVSGTILWTVKTVETISPLLCETGDGDIILLSENSLFLRISPFGELKERIPFAGEVKALSALPWGFASGHADGTIRAWDVRNKRGSGRNDSEKIWEYRGKGGVVGLIARDTTLFTQIQDGTMGLLNITDGTPLWELPSSKQNAKNAVSPHILYDDGSYLSISNDEIRSLSERGTLQWLFALPNGLTYPRISPSGILFAASGQWRVSAFRVESKIRDEKKLSVTKKYGILNGYSLFYGNPFAVSSGDIAAALDEISESLAKGSVGPAEVNYARLLSEIVFGTRGGFLEGDSYDTAMRSRAASLLGRLGSLEYRQVLLDALSRTDDESMAIGIVYGLSSIAVDTDGQSLAAIREVVRRYGPDNLSVLRASCDALYAIVRYSHGRKAVEGTLFLAEMARSPYDQRAADYARTTLLRIIQ